MKKIFFGIVIFLILSVALLEIVYLSLSSSLAAESVAAEKMRNEISLLDEENQILEAEVLSHSSLKIVASRAAELGFHKPEEFISIKGGSSIALGHE